MHVHEDAGITEVTAKPIIDPSGNTCGFLPPVREEDLRHRSSPGRLGFAISEAT